MRKLKTLAMIILIVLAVIFAAQNAATVEIQFLSWSFSTARALLVLCLLGVGFVLGVLVSGLTTRHHARDAGKEID